MRLQFGRPSLLILIFFAVVAAVLFYIVDNRSEPILESTPVAIQRVAEATQTPAPGTVLEDSSGEVRIVQSAGIPLDTTIFIPRAGIISNVIEAYLNGESWDISQLRTNVGHLEGTSWLDQPGNVVLSGHVEMSDGRPGVFANLIELNLDDLIVITSNGQELRYVVTEKYMTTPTDLTPLLPTTTERLTLITCNSYDFLSNSYLERIIVVAEPLG